MDITISNMLKNIYKRPGMYMGSYDNFEKYTSYVDGFLFGISLSGNIRDANRFSVLSNAFVEKHNLGKGSNVALAYLVGEILYKNCTEDIKK